MSELHDAFERNIRQRRLFRDGQQIVVAVSGGLDSMVLLDLLQQSAKEHAWRLTVAHLNHQLRGRSSDGDEGLVRRTAQKLRLPIVLERANVREFSRTEGISIEMAARKMRHDFLARTARRIQEKKGPRVEGRGKECCCVALAHHADDQLELFFLRLLRGSGGEGLAGMKWHSSSPSDPRIELVRPLLDQPKAALRAYATNKKMRFREDATNALLDFQRNRIRHELLPLLRKKYQLALDKTVLRMMEIVGAEAEFVTCAARDWLAGGSRVEGRVGKGRSKTHRLRAKRVGFEELPLALQRRCLQLQLLKWGVAADFDLVEQLRTKPNQEVTIGRSRAGGLVAPIPKAIGEKPDLVCAVRDSVGRVEVHRSEAAVFKDSRERVHLSKNGEVLFDGLKVRWQIKHGKATRRLKASRGHEFFDADKVGTPIVLRHWQPGDRFQPIGMDASVKLQDIFTNQRVPRGLRHELIVAATAQKEIFWVEGLRISERFKLTKSTIRRLQWRWQRF